MQNKERPFEAVCLGLIAYFGYSLQDAVIKLFAGAVPLFTLMLVHATNIIFLLAVAFKMRTGAWPFHTTRPKIQALRAAINGAGFISVYYALLHMTLPLFYTFVFLAPLFIALTSRLFLRDRFSWLIWAAVFIGVVGAFVVIQAPEVQVQWPALFVGLWIIAYCINVALVRKAPDDKPETFACYTYIGAAVFSLPLGVAGLHDITLDQAAAIFLAGVAAAGGGYCFYRANLVASPAYVAPTQYTQLIWGVFFGWALWGHMPSGTTYLGAALIIVAGFLAALASKKQV